MVTLATSQSVTDRCGVDANSTILSSSAIIERYIETSEGVVVGQTKLNYITDYANVDDSVKKLLLSCVASHAAKTIIAQDMSGYPGNDATLLLNVNQEEFTRTLKDLKDLDTNKPRSVST